MKSKHIGIIIIILSIVLAALVYGAKIREDRYINDIIDETGSCYLSDGTCLHEDRSMTIYIIGWAIAVAMILFGVYLTFFDRTEEFLEKHQVTVSRALENAKKEDRAKDEFKAFLAGFNADERKVIENVYDQDGIQQSTLRYKTGLSKAMLSLVLKSLEERGFVNRKESGKTKQVFFVKKF